MTGQQSYTIKIKEGNEHHSISLDVYDQSEYFYSAFKQAAAAITKIINLSYNFFNNETEDPTLQKFLDYSEYHNNIIAFCADRGQGKTSAMLSMAKALYKLQVDLNSDKDKNSVLNFWNDKSVNIISNNYSNQNNPVLSTKFVVLPTIDPTVMEAKDSILRTVISKMYKYAADKWSYYATNLSAEYNSESIYSLREKLANQFLTCFKGIDSLSKKETDNFSYYDDLNQLSELGDSTNIKESFSLLVDYFLQFMSAIENKRCINKCSALVIMIDDADLNTKNAYSIAEEIRKYLVLPQILVLMSVHVGTLSRIIEQYYLQQYSTILHDGTDKTINERCHQAMERYIDKLIPPSHRIHLQYISNFILDKHNQIELSYTRQDKELLDFSDLIKSNTNKSYKYRKHYQEQLIMLIYQKTGIILVQPDGYLHDFLPSNIRELNHFLCYMNNLEDVIRVEDNKVKGTFLDLINYIIKYNRNKKGDSKSKILGEVDLQLKNLDLFFNYFYNNWCPLNLSNTQLKIIENLRKSPRSLKNLRAVELLKEYINKETGQENAPKDYIEQKDLKGKETPFSDVIISLFHLKHLENPQRFFKLIYAVRLYFSTYFRKLALNGIADYILGSKNNPLGDFVQLTGGRIFPLEYYQIRKLPSVIFKIDKNTVNSINDLLNKDNDSTAVKALNLFTATAGLSTQSVFVDSSNPNIVQPRTEMENFTVLFYKNLTDKDNQKLEEGYLYFDYFKPIIALLTEKNIIDQFLGKAANCSPEILDSILNIICNVDIQELLYQKFFKKEEIASSTDLEEDKKCYDLTTGMYKKLDKIIKGYIFCDSSVEKIFVEKLFNNSKDEPKGSKYFDIFNELKVQDFIENQYCIKKLNIDGFQNTDPEDKNNSVERLLQNNQQ